jgi:UDP-N-acetylmuramoyl-tripeptide--D-alanyl-D-alanine ligase
MPVTFLVILGILWLISTIKAVLFWVYLWQLKEYHIKRFIDHFRTAKGKSLIFDKLRIIKIALLFLLFFNHLVALYILFIIYLLETGKVIIDFYRKRFLKPIFTGKTIFTVLLVILLEVILFFLIFENFLITDLLVPIIVALVILGLKPVTYLFVKRLLIKAKNKREQFKDLIVIGITGSYGKSSVKEFLYEILSEKYKVLKTERNNNAEVGIAKTILNKLNSNYQIFIVEMGAYERGRIEEDCKIVQPKIGILTGINQQHMATFGSQENIIKGKNEIFECLPENGIKIRKENLKFQVADIVVNKESVLFKINGIDFKVNLMGKHNIDNVLLAVSCAKELGMSLEEISRACLKIKPEEGGMKIIKRGNVTILDSSYSANPTGVIADLEYLKLYQGKKAIVMPCLIELGKASGEVHVKIAEKIDEVCDLAIIVTKECFNNICQKTKKALFIDNPQGVLKKLKEFNGKEDIILLEGRISKKIVEGIK